MPKGNPEKALLEMFLKIQGIQRSYMQTPEAKAIGEGIVEQIRKRTRLGKGVAGGKFGGEYESLDPLEEATVDARAKYKRNLSEFARPKKSNLTATGQLLDAIRCRIEGFTFIFFFENKRRGELGGGASTQSNTEVAQAVQKKRPFFTLSKSEYVAFQRKIRNDILKFIIPKGR